MIMIIIPLCTLAGLVCYGMGVFVGKAYAEQELQRKRDEMQIDEEDPYDELFK